MLIWKCRKVLCALFIGKSQYSVRYWIDIIRNHTKIGSYFPFRGTGSHRTICIVEKTVDTPIERHIFCALWRRDHDAPGFTSFFDPSNNWAWKGTVVDLCAISCASICFDARTNTTIYDRCNCHSEDSTGAFIRWLKKVTDSQLIC